jgi:hypothetical protein
MDLLRHRRLAALACAALLGLLAGCGRDYSSGSGSKSSGGGGSATATPTSKSDSGKGGY